MKSGLEGRNNGEQRPQREARDPVSMKSGLEGRNNLAQGVWRLGPVACLNEVRPGRPEQFRDRVAQPATDLLSQ